MKVPGFRASPLSQLKDAQFRGLTPKEVKRLHKLLIEVYNQHNRSLHSLLRYTWRPDTETGRKAYQAHENREQTIENLLNEMTDIMMIEPTNKQTNEE